MVEKTRAFHDRRRPWRGNCLPGVIYAVSEVAVRWLADANHTSIADQSLSRCERLWYGLARAALSYLGGSKFAECIHSDWEEEDEEENDGHTTGRRHIYYSSESDSDLSVLSDGKFYTFSRVAWYERERQRQQVRRSRTAQTSSLKPTWSKNSADFTHARWMNEDLLVAAAAAGDEHLCRRVLQDGIDVNSGSRYFGHAIHAGVLRGDEQVLRLLLQQTDLDVNLAHTDKRRTPLVMAAMRGDEVAVRLLLSMRDDIDANAEDKYNHTALRWACTRGHEGVVRLLLDYPATDINYGGSWRPVVPLEEAIRNHHEAIVRLLLEHPDINIRAYDQEEKRSLLSRSMWWYSHTEAQRKLHILQLLLDKDSSIVNATSEEEPPPLWVAATTYKSVPLVEFLMSQGNIIPNIRGPAANPPMKAHGRRHGLLHNVVALGHEAVLRELLRWDTVDPNLVDPADGRGYTPLHAAVSRGRHALIKALLEHKRVDVNATNASGQTPLALLASRTHADDVHAAPMAMLLLEREDIDVDVADSSGRTPLSYAAERENDALAQLLSKRSAEMRELAIKSRDS
ncbi:ankyrin repeat-containing domain protein [Aspergillus lucknowensis]|uniref:Ankyrin repeat-containing domain protein n=1 Tax=Aspergillus lucknowensis TaxID=176173 RepID=A0ABR4LT04_9EURO